MAFEDSPRCESRVVSWLIKEMTTAGVRIGSCGSYSEDSEGFRLKATCNRCLRKNRINIEREGVQNLVKNKKLKKNGFYVQFKTLAVDIVTDIVVRVPDLDRVRLSPRNVLAVVVNPLTPNDSYRGRTAPLTSKRCILYIFIQQIQVLNILNTVYTVRFFLFKMQFVS